jgi:signal transduction histidine kinase
MTQPRSHSLQLRLALSLAAVYLAATAIAIAGLIYQAYSTADELSKEDLNRRAKHLAVLATADATGNSRIDLPDWLDALYRSGTFIYAVNRPDGPVIAASNPEVADLVARLPLPTDVPAYFRLRSFGVARKDYFGLSARLASGIGPLRVTIARAADDDVLVHSLLTEFVWDLAWLAPTMVIATLAIGVLAIRRGLGPIRDVSASAAAINPGSISVRLPESDVPAEIQPLVAAVNHALDRLERGFVAQRQFTANAAHELRTPLAIITGALDSWKGDGEVAKLKSDVARMNRVVEQLLGVARLDAMALDVSGTVDLNEIAASVVENMAPWAIERHRTLAFSGTPAPVAVKGNAHAIEDAIRNLVENAVGHSPVGGEVVVGVHSDGSVGVADCGSGVPVEHRERIFDRFWRGKGSGPGGAGLGLAIVQEIMRVHHGTVGVTDNVVAGAVFTLRFAPLKDQLGARA